MRKIFFVLIIGVLFALPKPAEAASVSIKVTTNLGKAMWGVPLSCTVQKPSNPGDIPTPPVFSSLTTGGNGIATWTPETGDNFSFSCMVDYAITPDSCYSFSSGTGDFSLGGGDSREFTIVGSFLAETCGIKVQPTEAEALAHPYGSQRIDPIWGDKPKATANPTLAPTASPVATEIPVAQDSPTTTMTNSSDLEGDIAPNLLQTIMMAIGSFFKSLFNIR